MIGCQARDVRRHQGLRLGRAGLRGFHRERDGTPGARALDLGDDGIRPLALELLGHCLRKGRILDKHPAVEDELHACTALAHSLRAGVAIGGKRLRGFLQQLLGEGIAFFRCGEDGRRQRGDVGLLRVDGPGDQIVGFIEHQRTEDVLAQFRPFTGVIVVRHQRLQRALADVARAATVADDVPATTDFGRAAVQCAGKATTARAAENKHSRLSSLHQRSR